MTFPFDPEERGPLADPVGSGPVRRPAPYPVRPPPPQRPGPWRTVLIATLAATVASAVTALAFIWLGGDGGAAAPVTILERVETRIVDPADSPSTAAAVAQAVLPAIVTVEVSEGAGETFVASSSGSGVVLDTAGLLVTNAHVVEGAAEVRVVFFDGRVYDAEVLGTDTLTDLAVLGIEAVGLTPITLGASSDLAIGDTAIAVGSPLGLGGGPSVTVGVLSALERRVRTGADFELFGMLQTDAPITRGSSGGALVDTQGRLIGITTAIGVSDVGAEGLGFAIPVELVTRVTDDIIAVGSTRHAFLGITGDTFFAREADGALAPSGVVVGTIIEDSAAEAAGLEPGDLILSFDGTGVTTMEGLIVALRLYRVGDTVTFSIERAGEVSDLPIELLERPEGI
jgi:putative serine protease PepD